VAVMAANWGKACLSMEEIKQRIERGRGDVETTLIRVHKSNLIVGEHVTTAGDVVPASLWRAMQLVNEGLAALAE
jgi:hypothetical protein